MDVFDDLVGLVRVFPHPNLSIEVIGVEIDEARRAGAGRGYTVVDRRLREVVASQVLVEPADLWSLLPADLGSIPLHDPGSGDSAGTSLLAQRVAYRLRLTAAADLLGKTKQPGLRPHGSVRWLAPRSFRRRRPFMNVLGFFASRVVEPATGGSRGLGLATRVAWRRRGADLVLVGRETANLEARVLLSAGPKRRRGRGRRRRARSARRPPSRWWPSMAWSTSWLTMSARRIDVPTETLSTADWQRIIDLNLTSAFVWSKVVGGSMLEHGWGRVINVASISGLVAIADRGPKLRDRKAALISFTRAAGG
ncbi:MAG: SDR family oxidoreductase [Isosphaeraceae bacterium]